MTTTSAVELAVNKVRRAAFELSSVDEKQASRMLLEALKLQPGHAELLGDLAALHLQAGRHSQCIRAAREALAANPEHDESAYALALALEATGQNDEAHRLYAELAFGPRAERFARQLPQLVDHCRAKLQQLGADAAPQGPAPAPRPDVEAAAPAARPTPAQTRSPSTAGDLPYAPPLTRAGSLGQLLDETSGIRELTLDCFDTILWRHTDKPTDVFYEMQQRPAFRAAQIDALMRVNAEKHARNLQRVRAGRTEVSLEQIYLAARPEAGRDLLRWLAEDELAAEMHACHAHPGAVRLLRDAKARGVPVTIVSDTYFSSEQLGRLLAHCLPPDAFDAIRGIVCSSEHGVCKSQGLFKLARLNLAADASTILHVGDNRDADFTAPRALGMSASYLMHEADTGLLRRRMGAMALSMLDPSVRSTRALHMPYRAVHATCGQDSPPPHTAIGHAALGPVMHGFARWIDEEATTLSATHERVKLVFLMRDAHLPLQVYREIGGAATACAAHISRFSAYAASFRRLEHVDHYLANFARNATLAMIARQLLLPDDLGAQLIAQAEATANPLQHFLGAVRQSAVLAEIFAASKAFRERLRQYLVRETGLAPGDTIVLVDLGYAGTIQRVLGPVISEEWDAQVFGRYLLAVGATDDRRRALIDRRWLDDRTLATLQPYVGLLETLSTSDGASVVGYGDDGRPVFEDQQLDAAQGALVADIQAETLRFAREAEAYFRAARHMPPATVLRDEVLASFARMLFLPSEQELSHLARFELEINLGSGVRRRLFDLDAGIDGLRRHGLFYVGQVQAASDLRMTIPAELRAAGMELSLSLLAQHRFGLDIFRSEWSVRKEPLLVIQARGHGGINIAVDAVPTHDGYFSALVPISDSETEVALAFGRHHEWLQLHSIELLPMSDGNHRNGDSGADLRPLFVASGVRDHGSGLLQFAESDSLLMLPAGSLPCQGRAAIRVVFRPIAGRIDPAAA